MKIHRSISLLIGSILSSAGMAADGVPGVEVFSTDSIASTTELEEVSVTSVKQLTGLGRQPEAATILTRADMERLGVLTLRGISDVVPNFYMPEYGSRITSTIYVRGIGARMDNPSVGLNVDNVPYLNKDAYDFDIADIASVEMLRGPQSTLYGRNTMAGVINISTLSPMRFQGWRIMAEGANGGRIKGSVGWYGRPRHDFAVSLTGAYAHQEGFFRNEYDGKKLDGENNWSGRFRMNWLPKEGMSLQNVAAAGYLRQGGYPYESKKSGKIDYNDPCFYHRFTFNDGLTFRATLDRVTLTSITAVQHINDNMTLDQDFLPEEFFTLTQKKRETAVTEDMVVRGNTASSYSWLAGCFIFYKHLDMSAPVTFKEKGISDLIVSHRNSANPHFPIGWNDDSFVLNSDFRIPTVGAAVYHKSEFEAGNWHLSASLRLDYEHTTLDYNSRCNTSYTIYEREGETLTPYHTVPINIDDKGKLSKSFLTFLPEVAAVYTLPGSLGNVYGKVSKGYKAGGFNTQMFSDVLQQRLMRVMGIGAQYNVDDVVGYRPESSWNYEVGTHLSFAEGKMGLEAALFYIDCRDQQLTMFPDGTTTGRIMTNAGKTRSFGGELSLTWRPAERLVLNGSYGYTNARFKKFHNGINDFKGKYLPYAPQNTLFLQGVYELPIGGRHGDAITFDLNLRGTGKIYWNESNEDFQNFYMLLGASCTVGNDKRSLQVWGRNLTATRYHTFYFMSMGNEFFQRGRGVEFGATLRLSI